MAIKFEDYLDEEQPKNTNPQKNSKGKIRFEDYLDEEPQPIEQPQQANIVDNILNGIKNFGDSVNNIQLPQAQANIPQYDTNSINPISDDGILKAGIKKVQEYSPFQNTVTGQNVNLWQGLSNIGNDLSNFGQGLKQGLPEFINGIKQSAIQTGQNIQDNPSNLKDVPLALLQGASNGIYGLAQGIADIPEAIASSYNNRPFERQFQLNTMPQAVDFLVDSATNNGLLTPEQKQGYYAFREQQRQNMSSVPLATTLGEFLPFMIGVGGAAGLGTKTAQTAANLPRLTGTAQKLSNIQKAGQVAKDIAKAGAVGAAYGFAMPGDLKEKSMSAGAGTSMGLGLGATGKGLQKGGEAIAKAKPTIDLLANATKNEIKNRLNPENYETIIEQVPSKNKGVGLAGLNKTETRVRKEYTKGKYDNLEDARVKEKITDNNKGAIQEQQHRTNSEEHLAITDKNKNSRFKLVGKTNTNAITPDVINLSGAVASDIAPNIAKKVEENKQETKEQPKTQAESIAPNITKKAKAKKEKNLAKEEAYKVLGTAIGKDANYVKRHFKTKKVQNLIEKAMTDDSLSATIEGFESFADTTNGRFDTDTQEKLITQAIDTINGKISDSKELIQKYNEQQKEYGQYLEDGYNDALDIVKKEGDLDKAEQKIADVFDHGDPNKVSENVWDDFVKDTAEIYEEKENKPVETQELTELQKAENELERLNKEFNKGNASLTDIENAENRIAELKEQPTETKTAIQKQNESIAPNIVKKAETKKYKNSTKEIPQGTSKKGDVAWTLNKQDKKARFYSTKFESDTISLFVKESNSYDELLSKLNYSPTEKNIVNWYKDNNVPFEDFKTRTKPYGNAKSVVDNFTNGKKNILVKDKEVENSREAIIQEVKEVRTGKKNLTADTLYIHSGRSNAVKPKNPTSETTSTDTNIIPQSKENITPKETKKASVKKTEKSTKAIKDSGEFLQGNRKTNTEGYTWEELKDMNELVRAKNLTKAKIYPKPTVEGLSEQGLDNLQAAVVIHAYNMIANKPPQLYTNEAGQKKYTEKVKQTMDKIIDFVKKNPDKFNLDSFRTLNRDLFDAVFPDTENKVGRYGNVFRVYPEHNELALVLGGRRFVRGIQIATRDLKDIKKIIEDANTPKGAKEKDTREDWEKQFVVLEPDRWNNDYTLAYNKGKGNNQIIFKFKTKEAAIETAKKIIEVQKEAKNNIKKANFERDYIERRENNRDVTPDELRETFGFIGVNFGNYVNQKERQAFLNYAYDSLYDLAELLNVPIKALSLNGKLGLAFGAQGRGGKVAGHYIPAYQEINLTKDSGAGILAHEWWHAFDNYFGNKSKGKEVSTTYGTELKQKGEVREEVFEAFKELNDVMKNAEFTQEDIDNRVKAIEDRTRKNIDYYAKNLKKAFKNVDGVAEIVDDIVTNTEKLKNNSYEEMKEYDNKIFNLLPKQRQTIENGAKIYWLTNEIRKLGQAEELAKKQPKTSEYYKSAEKLNEIGGMGKDYWTSDTELGARAFATYLLDKMETKQIANSFLVRNQDGEISIDPVALSKSMNGDKEAQPFVYWNPKNAEEKARIFKAFDKLFDTVKTRETDKGVEFYDIELYPIDENIKTIGKYDLNLKSLNNIVKKGTTVGEIAKHLPEHMQDLVTGLENVKVRNMNVAFEKKGKYIQFTNTIKLNLEAVGNNPYKFIKTFVHELEHARQKAYYEELLQAKARGEKLTREEIDYMKAYKNSDRLNKVIQAFRNQRYVRNIVNKFNKATKGMTRQEAINYIKKFATETEKNIIIKDEKYYNKYLDLPKEIGAREEGGKYAKDFKNETRIDGRKDRKLDRFNSQWNVGTSSWLRTRRTNRTDGFSERRIELYEKIKNIKDQIKPSSSDTEIKSKAKAKIRQWVSNINVDRLDLSKEINSFVQDAKKIAKEYKVSDKLIRETMPFLRERTGIPEALDRQDIKDFYNSLSQKDKNRLTLMTDGISNKLEKYYEKYQESRGIEDYETIQNHISHIWDVDDKKLKTLTTNYFQPKSRFAKQRTVETLLKGIDGIELENGEIMQLKPKTLDYAEILNISTDSLIKATHDMQLANAVKNLKYKGKGVVLRADKAPSDWVELDHPALRKSMYLGENDENIITTKKLVKVHPAIARTLQTVFETQAPDNKFFKGYDTLSNTMKTSQLGFSAFHGMALTESALGNIGLKKTAKILNPVKMINDIKNSDYDVYKDPMARQAVQDGVKLGTPSDLNREAIEELADGIASKLEKIPSIGKAVGIGAKIASKAVKINNNVLWDYLHNNFKLESYKMNIALAEKKKGSKLTDKERQDVAQWVNDSFGGQNWELLGVKPSETKASRRLLLSPDWLTSTTRQFVSMFRGGATGNVARHFWVKALAYSVLFYNLINAAYREDDRKKHPELYKEMKPLDYTIWGNSDKTDSLPNKAVPYIFIGRNEKGQAQYLRLGKQFREVPELATEPLTKLAGKANPVLQLGSQMTTGKSLNQITTSNEDAYLNQDLWEGYGSNATRKTGSRLLKGETAILGKSFLPFSATSLSDKEKTLGSKAWGMIGQTSKGLTSQAKAKPKIAKAYESYYAKGDKSALDSVVNRAYKDGMTEKNIKTSVTKGKTLFLKPYKNQVSAAINNNDGNIQKQTKEVQKIVNDMKKHNIPKTETQKIVNTVWENYQKKLKNAQ